ncbi:hypothetical protein GUITHDRAFT_80497 [Guillardia theta CCMP2712]|uniref:F-box domain-containing protein n=1 Tax=Guillardia theta (strain CCMP2712) TaxID=905079 RepID=L1IE07_GUITC|nr:hypothetical protein GUITHDRAFT_80497 [Guillardia theta CCMP2712]EKX34506.1 hypothetical protein GUITHDRAFT_80497 [Guillardia theta CCMP2712]|eukprot:XP_005821486.1 hypothetical protein GUITHDRAFT_80497 [Guillardia theta CCMP2712]
MVVKIFLSLTPKELGTCSCVCRQWREVACSDAVWETQCRRRGWTSEHRAWSNELRTLYDRYRDLAGRRVFAWGSGEYGQIGLVDEKGREVTSRQPMEVKRLAGMGIVLVACGSAHSSCLAACGRIWTWGCGKYGRLGHGGEKNEPQPREVSSLPHRAFLVACGGSHTVASVYDQEHGRVELYAWGSNMYGECGTSDHLKNNDIPQYDESSTTRLFTRRKINLVSAGSVHSAAICCDGEVYTFGRDCMPKLKGGGGRLGHGRHLSLHGIRDEVE